MYTFTGCWMLVYMLPGGRGRGPAGVARMGVLGRLEPMLEKAQEQRQLSLFTAIHHIHSFLDSFPIQVITECIVEFPVVYSRFLLIIC